MCEEKNMDLENKNSERNSDVLSAVSELMPLFGNLFNVGKSFGFAQALDNFEKAVKEVEEKSLGVVKTVEDGSYKINVNVADYKPEEITVELNRSERTVTIEASHEVNDSSSEGSTYHNSRYMKVVEIIPDDVDIYTINKEFDGSQLVISGRVGDYTKKEENIVKL